MSVLNLICEKCEKRRVCSISKKILAFDNDDPKKDLGVDLTMDSCREYKEEE